MASAAYTAQLSVTPSKYIDVKIETTPNTNGNYSTGKYSVVFRVGGSSNYYKFNYGNKLIVKINNEELVNSSNICAIQLSSAGTSKEIASGTFVVSHDDNGACSFPVYVYFDQTQKDGHTATVEETFTCDKILRKSSLTVSDGILDVEQTLKVTKQSTAYTHTITAICGAASTTICTKSTLIDIPFTPPLEWANQNITSTSVSVKYKIETFNGNTSIGSNEYTVSCGIPEEIKPIATVELTDAEGHVDTYGKYVQGKSKLQVVITAEGAYGSTIKTYKTTVDGKTYTEAEIITEYLAGKNTLDVVIEVTDTRNRLCKVEKQIEVYEYNPPKIIAIKAKRCKDGDVNTSGDDCLGVIFSSEVTSLDGKNSVVYTLDYKKTTGEYYNSEIITAYTNQYIVNNGNYTFSADNDAYNVILRITDSFGVPVEKKINGPSLSVLISKLKHNLGMAIGKLAELEGVLDIGFKTRFFGGILQMVLEEQSDFNELKTPNIFTLKDISNAGYLNCPVSEGKGSLKVEECGEGCLHHTLKIYGKSHPIVYERMFCDEGWSSWVLINGDWISKQCYGCIYGYVGTSTLVAANKTIPFVEYSRIGDYFEIDTNGQVVVGENVSLVRVTATVGGQSVSASDTGRCYAHITKNSTIIAYSRAIQYGVFTSPIIYQVLEVEKGDVIAVGVMEDYYAYGGSVPCTIVVERIR